MSQGSLLEIERILAEGEDADAVLRRIVAALVAGPTIVWAGIGFLEDGAIALGPVAGEPDETRRRRVPVRFQGDLVGELWADGEPDRALLEQIAARIAPQVLIGWDTGGEVWEP